jgi:hydrogenase maturation protein HypF
MARASSQRARGPSSARRRARAQVTGSVQGVGFRPHVFRLAKALGLGGYVLNDTHGVLVEVEGPPAQVEEFMDRLAPDAPPLATVERVVVEEAQTTGERGFRIVQSETAGEPDVLVSPDTATCRDCLSELFDPGDRRFRYPFVNCTHCGPRFTIVHGVPYDRALTTMASFEMCARCWAEYEDPHDRRFHAQPNACPQCGPRVRLVEPGGRERALEGHRDAIEAAAAELERGRIIAVKGLGGFHLACRADDEQAVAALRARKHREDKPFAVMTPALADARELVELTGADERALSSRERPIVIAPRRDGARVAAAVAPRSRDLGVMLPYSPLHHLLLADTVTTLVMTSGNRADEPIAYRDEDALERLGGIADLFLIGDRAIETRADDSVLRSVGPAVRPEAVLLRRSRGYVPAAVPIAPAAERAVLGCGAELKNTFCLAKGARAWVGPHIGDLKDYETLESFRDGIEHLKRLFAVDPAVVAHDLHPDYLSTRYALGLEGVRRIAVQHHHAHLAACVAEHAHPGPVVAAIYDGTGYGPDATVWGGELLVGDAATCERRGTLVPVRLPGGDAAIREPWRMACAWLIAALEDERPPIPDALRDEVDGDRWAAVSGLVARGLNSPPTTSVGRLFDAVAALCGVRGHVNYEGQAAAELEGISDPAERGAYPMPLTEDGAGEAGSGTLLLDARDTVRAVVDDLRRGAAPGTVGGRFHETLARATAAACEREAERSGLDAVALSGGVFQNRLLLERTAELLEHAGMRVLIPLRLPPNDGGIAYGQVAVAVAQSAGRAGG